MTENEIATIVIGQAIEVHKHLGPGLLESPYEECLFFRLIKAGLYIEKQKPIPLIFEGVKMDCGFRCDLMVEKKVIVEVKAIEMIAPIHISQVITYLKLTDTKLGLLINFNVVKLKDGVRRVANNM
jgi:GxxExxY protein